MAYLSLAYYAIPRMLSHNLQRWRVDEILAITRQVLPSFGIRLGPPSAAGIRSNTGEALDELPDLTCSTTVQRWTVGAVRIRLSGEILCHLKIIASLCRRSPVL